MSDAHIRYTYAEPNADRIDVKVHVDDDLGGQAIEQAITGFTNALVILANLPDNDDAEPEAEP